MYLRFVSPFSHGGSRRDVHYGIFQAAFHCRDSIPKPDWLQDCLSNEIEVLKSRLKAPPDEVFDLYAKPGHYCEPVCWFKPRAEPAIRQCWTVKSLLDLCGVPICLRRTRDPGYIIYEDTAQVVTVLPVGTVKFG